MAKLEGRDPEGLLPSDDPAAGAAAGDAGTARNDRSGVSGREGDLPAAIGTRPLGEWRPSQITTDTIRQFQRNGRARRAIGIWRCCGRRSTGRSRRVAARPRFASGTCLMIRLAREEARNRRSTARRSRTAPGGGDRPLRDSWWPRSRPAAAGRAPVPAVLQVRFSPRAEIFLAAAEDEDQTGPPGADLQRLARISAAPA